MERGRREAGSGKRLLTLEELSALTLHAPLRERVILHLLLETGCELQELVNLTIRDICRPPKVSILIGRGAARRSVSISPALRSLLSLYLRTLCAGSAPTSYLFSTRESPRMTTRRVEQLLAAVGRRSLGYPITPRRLRSTAIIGDFLKGVPIAEIERKTGLRSVRYQLYEFFRDEGMRRVPR